MMHSSPGQLWMVTVMIVGMIVGCGTGPEPLGTVTSLASSVPELLLASVPEAGTPSDDGGRDGAFSR